MSSPKNLTYCKCGHLRLAHEANRNQLLIGPCTRDDDGVRCLCRRYERQRTSPRHLRNQPQEEARVTDAVLAG